MVVSLFSLAVERGQITLGDCKQSICDSSLFCLDVFVYTLSLAGFWTLLAC
jgi:hypothetical protein